MAKIILYSAVSIDGYIAKCNGAVDWLDGYDEEGTDYGYSEFYQSIDTILMGKNTYQQVLSFDMEYPYADKESFVFSTSLSSAATPNTRIIKENYIEFTKNLKNTSAKDIWLVGGGSLNGLLLQNRLIDELILSVIPVILGEGIPLFNDVNKQIPFSLNKVESYSSGIVQQYYSLK